MSSTRPLSSALRSRASASPSATKPPSTTAARPSTCGSAHVRRPGRDRGAVLRGRPPGRAGRRARAGRGAGHLRRHRVAHAPVLRAGAPRAAHPVRGAGGRAPVGDRGPRRVHRRPDRRRPEPPGAARGGGRGGAAARRLPGRVGRGGLRRPARRGRAADGGRGRLRPGAGRRRHRPARGGGRRRQASPSSSRATRSAVSAASRTCGSAGSMPSSYS